MEDIWTVLFVIAFCVLTTFGSIFDKSHRYEINSWAQRGWFFGVLTGMAGYFFVFPEEDKNWYLLFVFVPFFVSIYIEFFLKLFFSKTHWYRNIWINEKLDEEEKHSVFNFEFDLFRLGVPVREGDYRVLDGVDCQDKNTAKSYNFSAIEGLECEEITFSEILFSSKTIKSHKKDRYPPNAKVFATLYKFDNAISSQESILERAIANIIFVCHFLPKKADRFDGMDDQSFTKLYSWDSSISECCASYASGHKESIYRNYHMFIVCSDNILLRLTFSSEKKNADNITKPDLEGYVNEFVNSFSIEIKNGFNKLNVDMTKVETSVLPEDFYTTLSDLKDVDMILGDSPHSFSDVIDYDVSSEIYEKYCKVYNERRSEFIKFHIENWSIK